MDTAWPLPQGTAEQTLQVSGLIFLERGTGTLPFSKDKGYRHLRRFGRGYPWKIQISWRESCSLGFCRRCWYPPHCLNISRWPWKHSAAWSIGNWCFGSWCTSVKGDVSDATGAQLFKHLFLRALREAIFGDNRSDKGELSLEMTGLTVFNVLWGLTLRLWPPKQVKFRRGSTLLLCPSLHRMTDNFLALWVASVAYSKGLAKNWRILDMIILCMQRGWREVQGIFLAQEHLLK